MKHGRVVWCAIGVALLVAGSFPGPAHAAPMEFLNGVGINYGVGIDTIKFEGKRVPLVNTTTGPLPGGGQTRESDVWRMETSSEMEQLMSFSAELGYSSSLLGAGVSNTTSYMKKHTLNAYTLSYVVRSAVLNSEFQVQNPQLNQEAKGLLGQGGQGFALFRASYGDGFVRGMMTGGEYYGMVNIKTTSESNMSEVKSKLKASYMGVSGSAEFQTSMNEVSKISATTIKEIVEGGRSVPVAQDLKGVINNANNLARYVSDPAAAVPISIDVADYQMFPEYYTAYVDLGYEKRVILAELQRNYLDYTYIKNTLQYVTDNGQEFRFNPDSKNAVLSEIAAKKREIDTALAKIEQKYFEVAAGKDNSTTLSALGIQSASDFSKTLRLPPRYLAAFRWPPDRSGPPGYWLESIPTQHFNPLPGPTRGDSEMDGHKPKTTIDASLILSPDGTTVTLRCSASMVEDRKDWTTFKDSRDVLLLDLRGKGYRIKRLVGPTTGRIVWKAPGDFHSERTITPSDPANSLLVSAVCKSDTKGKDKGKLYCKNIVFNNFGVEYAHNEDYPTPQPYHDAPATAQRPSPVTAKIFAGKFLPVNRNLLMRSKSLKAASPARGKLLPTPLKAAAVQRPAATPRLQTPAGTPPARRSP